MTTPGPAATVAATCMAAAVGVNNPWAMGAGDPMAVGPGVAVRCNAEGAGAEAVVDPIKRYSIFFFFIQSIADLSKDSNKKLIIMKGCCFTSNLLS